MTLLPKVKLKTLVSFPATVLDGTGIDVTRANGSYQFNLDFADFAPPVSGLTDPTNQNALLWNSTTGHYDLIPVSILTGSGVFPATAFPLIESGSGAVGSSVKYAREDHVHPAITNTFIQSGTGAITRTMQDKARDVVTPEDFGAVGDGATDDTAALTSALATGKPVYLTKTYKVTSTVSVTNKAVTIFGGGTITKTSGSGFALSISNSDYTQPVSISGLKILTTQTETSKGLFIGFSEADATNNRLQHRCTLRDVEIRGQDVASHGFLYGIELSNVHRPSFYGVQIAGRQSGSTITDFQHMDRGWNIYSTGAAAPTDYTFVSCQVIAAASAFYGRVHLEGLTFSQCYAIAVNKGWDMSLTAAWPWFTATQCHAAVFGTGFELTNFGQSNITDCLIYRRIESTGNTVGILLASCSDSSVTGNRILDPGGAASGLLYGIQITDSNRVTTALNEIAGANIGVTVNGTSSDCKTYNNDFNQPAGGSPLAYQMSGSGTGNIRFGQTLDVSARNSGGAVAVSGGSAVAVTSTATDALEVGDDVEVFFAMQCDKDANAGHCRALVVKTGTATVLFDNNLTQLDVEVYSAASQSVRLRGSAKGRVTVRGTCTLALQGFSPTNAFTVPSSGGQINVIRR